MSNFFRRFFNRAPPIAPVDTARNYSQAPCGVFGGYERSSRRSDRVAPPESTCRRVAIIPMSQWEWSNVCETHAPPSNWYIWYKFVNPSPYRADTVSEVHVYHCPGRLSAGGRHGLYGEGLQTQPIAPYSYSGARVFKPYRTFRRDASQFTAAPAYRAYGGSK